jgi:hypothetical protein
MTNTKSLSITHDVVQLCDEFTEINSECAFLCDAISQLIKSDVGVEPRTAQGLELYCTSIKSKMINIENQLYQLHEKLR